MDNSQFPSMQPFNGAQPDQPISSGNMPPVQPMMANDMSGGASGDPAGTMQNGMASGGMTPNGMAPNSMAPNGMVPNGMPMNGTAPMMPNGMAPNGTAPTDPTPNGMPMVQQVNVIPPQKKDYSGLIKTIVIIAVSLIAVTFIGLFIWMSGEKEEAETNLNEKIASAVAVAKDELTTKLNKDFMEKEKYPYSTFSGPENYGLLTFEYPKTWSVYVAESAVDGGDFNAYFNPIQVDAVGKDTLNALRVTIRNESFEKVSAEYDKAMAKKDSNLTMTTTKIGRNGDVDANRYTGTIPDTELQGIIVTFTIRDKTVIMQTDTVMLQEEFDKLLGTVIFNK